MSFTDRAAARDFRSSSGQPGGDRAEELIVELQRLGPGGRAGRHSGRVRAAIELAFHADEPAIIPPLAQATRDSSEGVRIAAWTALAELRYASSSLVEGAGDRLGKLERRSEAHSPGERLAIVRWLAMNASSLDDTQLATLGDRLLDGDADVGRFVLIGLRRAGHCPVGYQPLLLECFDAMRSVVSKARKGSHPSSPAGSSWLVSHGTEESYGEEKLAEIARTIATVIPDADARLINAAQGEWELQMRRVLYDTYPERFSELFGADEEGALARLLLRPPAMKGDTRDDEWTRALRAPGVALTEDPAQRSPQARRLLHAYWVAAAGWLAEQVLARCDVEAASVRREVARRCLSLCHTIYPAESSYTTIIFDAFAKADATLNDATPTGVVALTSGIQAGRR